MTEPNRKSNMFNFRCPLEVGKLAYAMSVASKKTDPYGRRTPGWAFVLEALREKAKLMGVSLPPMPPEQPPPTP